MTATLSDLHYRIIERIPKGLTGSLGVAVSGGSDSMGLLVVLKDWRDAGGPDVRAVTVDHGLRVEAAQEADLVAEYCARFDIPHTLLHWRDHPQGGNLSDHARRARYSLIAEWAVSNAIAAVAVAHTRDDQAETVLMRLARASGVDGLAAMAPDWTRNGARFLRPALSIWRAELRALLTAQDVRWVEDPTNANPAYDRARIRAAWPELAKIGLTPEALCQVSGHMAAARNSLDAAMWKVARRIARVEKGDVLIDLPGLQAADPDCARRLLTAAMYWINGADYTPRGASQLRLLETVTKGRATTLQGCQFLVAKDVLRITREAKAVENLHVPLGEVWDGRWRLTGPDAPGAVVAALGEKGLSQCPDRAVSGLPAVSLRASPALWRGGVVLSAPLACLENGWDLRPVSRHPHDFAAQITH